MPRWTPPIEPGHPFLAPPPPPPHHHHHRPPHERPPHEVLGEGLACVSAQVDDLIRAVAELKGLLQARNG